MHKPFTYDFVRITAPLAVAFYNEEEDGQHRGPVLLNLETMEETDIAMEDSQEFQEIFSKGNMESISCM